ncbi:hypothetical protein ACVWZB_002770 [Paenibacillus polymyxa]
MFDRWTDAQSKIGLRVKMLFSVNIGGWNETV